MVSPATTIGLGAGEVIEVNLSLDEVRRLLQRALLDRTLLEFELVDGNNIRTVIINPLQVKVIWDADRPGIPCE